MKEREREVSVHQWGTIFPSVFFHDGMYIDLEYMHLCGLINFSIPVLKKKGHAF